jgi:hypothetical protein
MTVDERDELVTPPAPDPIHALLEEAATHREWRRATCLPVCVVCWGAWPCLVASLAAEVHALRKERLRRMHEARPPYRRADGWTPAELAELLLRDSEILKAAARDREASS